ncbi:MAG TPA: phosphate ABC transporter permease subunit PstC [Acidobacteriaceae bacterium]|nr:phosphate ABC transporter permease subunit PstC [Acidobacteriaceae bacterium]
MTLRIQEPRAPKIADELPVGGLVSVVEPASPVRSFLLSRGNSSVADATFRWVMLACALSIFAIVALIFTELITHSQLTLAKFGWKFFVGTAWDPVNSNFGALPFLYGTIVSSVVALVIAVPLAVGVAVFLTEMCPQALRGILSFLTELLAAIPSVVYGLWGIFVLVPLLRGYVDPLLMKVLGWTGLFVAPDFGVGLFAAGVILAIMILPIISSLTREVMSAVPHMQREAVLALGATRWEMIRMGVLRNARIGIVGSIILGLGRALGETMAVAMVIGSSPTITRSLLAPAATMASVIANEFSEAADDTYRSALIEIGLALFLVTIVVNILARLLVWAVTRGAPARQA